MGTSAGIQYSGRVCIHGVAVEVPCGFCNPIQSPSVSELLVSVTADLNDTRQRAERAEAALAESREQYAKLAEHHRQCELAGTHLAQEVRRTVLIPEQGAESLLDALEAWDAHQWPEIMNAEMGDEQ